MRSSIWQCRTVNGFIKLGLLFLFSMPSIPCSGQPATIEKLADSLFASVDEGLRPGLAVSVVKDGKVVLNKGYGYASLEHKIKITSETVFDLASVSKQFCAFAIATLVDQGEINLEDDIRKYVPELPDFGKRITIDHLVHHTGGIRDWTSILPVAGWSFDDAITFDQILRATYDQKGVNFEPGEEYSYSNSGYNLLALVVERVTGSSFAEWSTEHIFKPLGMTQTLVLDDHRHVIPKRASGYYQASEGWSSVPNLLTALGSSSMFSSTTDMAKWMSNFKEHVVGTEAVHSMIKSRGVLNDGEQISYAFGLSVTDFRGTQRISHSGSWAMFRTYVCTFPEYNLSIVVLNNHPANSAHQAMQLASHYIPKDEPATVEPPIVEPSFRPSKPQLEVLTGVYRLGPSWYVRLTHEDGKLWTQATQENRFPMVPLSDTLFRIEAYGGRTMRFVKGNHGEIDHLVYNGMICPKMADTDVSMLDYVGRYYSAELDTEYQIVVRNDSLSMHHFHHGMLKLEQAHGDDYRGDRWFIQSVEFSRNPTGNVIGMNISSGRARNLWFGKVD